MRAPGPSPSPAEARWFAPAFIAIAVAILVVAGACADRVGASAETILSIPWPPAEALIAAGGALERLGRRTGGLTVQGLALLAVGVAFLLRRRGARGVGPVLLAAAAMGWAGERWVLDGRLAVAGVAFAAAAALFLAPRQAAAAPVPPARPGATLLAATLCLVLFVLFCLYGLDVYPPLYFDEVAYGLAARKHLGILQGRHVLVYDLDKFRGQPVPLFLQATAVHYLHRGVVAQRLVSVAAGALALVVTAIALRRRLGARPVLWMLLLAATSPLYVHNSRMGQYMAVSVLHGALALAALLRLVERRDVGTAAVLGVLLGGSLYFYQLSWFVPVLAGLGLLALPEVWRRPGAARLGAAIAVLGVATALPAFTVGRDALRAVSAQSFDRATWRDSGTPSGATPGVASLVGPDTADPAQVVAEAMRLRAAGLVVSTTTIEGGHPLVWVAGPLDAVEAAVTRFEAAGWRSLTTNADVRSPRVNVGYTLRGLFAGPSFESWLRIIDGPLLNPIVAPLLLLGLLHAVRRWRDPVMRLVVVWVVGGALLPPALSGAAPRRVLLMLPLAWAAAGLVVDAGLRALGRGGPWRRAATAAVAAVLGTAVVATNAHVYFRQWSGGYDPAQPSLLALAKALKRVPAHQRILLVPALGTPGLGGHPNRTTGRSGYLDAIEGYSMRGRRARVTALPAAVTREEILRRSCREPVPFAWVVPADPADPARFDVLTDRFRQQTEAAGSFRVHRVFAPRPGACSGLPPPQAGAAARR